MNVGTCSQQVWDLPLRLFHWLLALTVTGAVATGWIGGNLMVWHGRLGTAIAALIAFRLAWGLVGSPTARFTGFVRGPDAIRAYLRGEWRGIGHNPLGALSVLALLATLGFQAASGHFAYDDIAFTGPLADAVAPATRDRITALHHGAANLVLILVGLHLAAIAYYLVVKKRNLVRPMLTGRDAAAPGGTVEPPRRGGSPLALLFALAFAAGAVWLLQGTWLEAPPPVEAAPTYDW